jgi:hypothetical protein
MSLHHFKPEFTEAKGTALGGVIGYSISFIKKTIFFIFSEELLLDIIRDCIVAIPAGLVGCIVGFYGTKLVKWFHNKYIQK